MTHRVLNKHKAKSIIQIYSDVMKTIQCAHPPHHHNGFVATCRLWTAIYIFIFVSLFEIKIQRFLRYNVFHVFPYIIFMFNVVEHGIIISTGITCKKIPL